MARIPRTTSTRQLEVTGPSPISPNAFTAPGVALTEFGSSIEQIGTQMGRVRDLRQSMFAESTALQGINAIQFNAKTDTNPDNRQIYLDQLNNIQNAATAGLPESFEKFKLQSSINNSVAAARLKIHGLFNTKNIDRAKETVELDIQSFKFNFFDATNDTERDLILSQTNNRIDQAIAEGIWDPVFAGKRRESIRGEWAQGEFDRDLFGDPKSDIAPMPIEQIKAKLESGAYNFNLEERIDAQKTLAQITEKRKLEQIEQRRILHTRNANDLWIEIMAGNKGFADIIIGFQADQISIEDTKSMIDNLKSDKNVLPITDKDRAMSLIEKGLDGNQNLREFNIAVRQANTDGALTFEQMTILTQSVAEDFQRAEVERIWMSKWKRAKKAVIDGFKRITSPLGIFGIDQLFRMTMEFMARTNDPRMPVEEVKAIGKDIERGETVNNNPGLATLDDIPSSIFSNQKGFDNVNQNPSKAKVQFVFDSKGNLIRKTVP